MTSSSIALLLLTVPSAVGFSFFVSSAAGSGGTDCVRRPALQTIDGMLNRRSALAQAALGAAVFASPAFAAETEFTTTASGLRFYDKVSPKSGAVPRSGQNVKVHYEGWLNDFDDLEGKFDSSYERRKPLSFAVGTGRVIKAWDEAILTAGGGMMIGTTRKIIVPAALGYGSAGAGGIIPPDATLYFEMKLLSIEP